MVQLEVLSGKQAGALSVARHFPFSVGRSRNDSLCLEDPGVWDGHLQFTLNQDAVVVTSLPEASLLVNGKRTGQAALRNGDLIEIGAVKLRFWLSPTPQISLRPRECLTWISLVALAALEIALILWLIRSPH